jgi:hypothetical protein
MLVRYKPKDDHVKCIPLIPIDDDTKKIVLTRSQVQLLPGTNEVTDDEWKVMLPHIKDEIKTGVIVPVSKKVTIGKGRGAKAGTAQNLKDMPVKLAVKYVADCANPYTLNAWIKTETRDEVRLAIVKRMEQLKIDVPGSEIENDDDTDIDLDAESGAEETEGGNENGNDDKDKE